MARVTFDLKRKAPPPTDEEGIDEHLFRTLGIHNLEQIEIPAYTELKLGTPEQPDAIQDALNIARSINISTTGLGQLGERYGITPKNSRALWKLYDAYMSELNHYKDPNHPLVLSDRNMLLAALEGNLYPRSKKAVKPVVRGVVNFFMNVLRAFGGQQGFGYKGLRGEELSE